MPDPSNKSVCNTGSYSPKGDNSTLPIPDTSSPLNGASPTQEDLRELPLPSADLELKIHRLLAQAEGQTSGTRHIASDTTSDSSRSDISSVPIEPPKLVRVGNLDIDQAGVLALDEAYHPLIVEYLLQRGNDGRTRQGSFLAAHLGLFKGIDHNKVFERLVEASPEDAQAAIINFKNFVGVDANYAAYRVLPVSGCASCLADNIDAFPEVNRTALAEKMLEPHIGAF
ncbi:MAG: hypothetical protein RL518_701, partial [Pseudomonadota bacterium]